MVTNSHQPNKKAAQPGDKVLPDIAARIVAVALAALILEVVGGGTLLSEVLSGTTAKIFAPVLSWMYARDESKNVSDHLVVVDVDIPLVQGTPGGWPFTYGHHARLLEKIRRQHPKALFVDFQFQAPRDDSTLPRLLETLCAFKADSIPVFLAAGTETSMGQLRPELENLRDAHGAPCFQKVSVNSTLSSVDQVAWTYALRSQVGDAHLPSAGLAMAEALRGSSIDSAANPQAAMGLTWAGGSADQGPKWLEDVAVATEPGATLGDRHTRHYCKAPGWEDMVLLRDWWVKFTGQSSAMRPACPSHKSLPAAWLTAPKTPDQAHDLRDRLQGRGVFYGGSFDANDQTLSPIHGRIPGIYQHVQATDNLLRYGDDWRRASIGGRYVHGEMSEHVVWFAGFLIISTIIALGRLLLVRHEKAAPQVDKKSKGQTKSRYKIARHSRKLASAYRRLPKGIKATLALIFEKLSEFFRRLGWFYLALVLVAIPMAWVLDAWLNVALIAYAPLLSFTLLGEVLSYSEDAKGFEEDHAPSQKPDVQIQI
jgi:hypothetical protein